MPNHGTVEQLKVFKGLNNVIGPESTNQSYLKRAENIDIDKTGGIKKRKGYTKVDTAIYSSLWGSELGNGCFAVRNGNLVSIVPNYPNETLVNGLGNIEISFEESDNKVYYTSPETNGIIENGVRRDWGIDINQLAPTLTQTNGSLSAGTYQVGFTYLNDFGLEGGVNITSSITIQEGKGISFTIPSSSKYTLARVYLSTTNGRELFAHGIAVTNSTYVITDQRDNITPIRTFNLYPPPKGHIVKYYRGRLYIAEDNVLWYSEPFQYEHFKLDSNYFEFPERIKEIMPVEDGIWIASDSLYYLSGTQPEDFNKTTKEHINIYEGTAQKISGSYIHLDNTPIGYKWLVTSDLGIFVLFNQGLVINLTVDNLAVSAADKGTSVFLQDSGLNQYLSILKTNENPNNSVFGDFVETQIIRNGVIIN